ncbi:MAG: hypothetical protein GKC03_09235 [Methanomassiliicoccales archaeon]|nr:hypothetical protein [Methanomassiliicoccales archaeon]NYT14621.1 hypothetical protein [Methanomassiliicoccales archaeon]
MERRTPFDQIRQRDCGSTFSCLVIGILLILSILAFIPAGTEVDLHIQYLGQCP